MKADLVFALDVGGTFIKACVIEQTVLMDETVCEFEAHSQESKDILIDHFANILETLARKYTQVKELDGGPSFHGKSIGIGFAFPGPFDYENGISFIKGLNKFESLYGVSLREQLLMKLSSTHLFEGTKEIQLSFENDGRLFGLGASTNYPGERLICLTIGTGLGSVFIDEGNIIYGGEHVPAGGYLYNQWFQDQMVDDHFSRRGILKVAAEEGLLHEGIDVKDIAELAKSGNKQASSIFLQFGSDLGEMLLPFIEQFHPDRIIIGGQIAKSFDLFQSSLNEKLHKTSTKTTSLEHALKHTFIGISRLFA
ncbi:ROK family protein [Bacillus sp. sid0103]|uniref:ROK family protein n=1 Tax=Bacillus sp. sid0103 TaxID=2856337 RepID=UPI001C475020|nr:ROK family protein [Bacillus sp. sid0103]MBV7504364.1 ROK family protein [Bacillus sp. sid0103]